MKIRPSRAAINAGMSVLWVAQAVQAEGVGIQVRPPAFAQGVGAAPAAPPMRAKAKLAAAALAAQKDTDPVLNGSISCRNDQPIIAEMLAAAEAARRDQDPSANGAVGAQGPAGVMPEAVAKR